MKNLIGLWPNLEYAYQIALLGDLSIQILFDKEYIQGFDDYEEIKKFFTGVNFVKKGDLVVEISKPDYFRHEKYDDLAYLQDHVNRNRMNVLPTEFAGSACNILLKTAVDRLNLSLSDRERVIKIASLIGKLSNHSNITVEDVAVAIHYIGYDYKNKCNAETRSIFFGKEIQIGLGELYYSDIEEAIKYLQSL